MRLSMSLAALGLAASALPAAAGTLLVPQQFSTIQKAVNAARPGDTVLVSPKPKGGVYNEAVTITTPYIVLQGQGNPVLDGTGLGKPAPPVPFTPPSTLYPNEIEIRASHVAVRGLTIQNGGGNTFGPGASAVNVGYIGPDGQNNIGFSDIEISSVVARSNYNGITITGYNGADPTNGGTPTFLKNYQLLGNTVTGSANNGVSVIGQAVLISGNQITTSGNAGLQTDGDGITVTGNEVASSAFNGVLLNAPSYNPNFSPHKPNPAANIVTGNSIHDNQYGGLEFNGAQTVTGNLITHNGIFGLSLSNADYSTVSANVITDTSTFFDFDGNGLSVDYIFYAPVTISANEVSGNGGDGIFLGATAGSKVVGNDASGNGGIGIHLSDYATSNAATPNLVTLNVALFNTVFDAKDDASAPDGDGVPTVNIWTKNLFGTTDPKGLSK